MSHKDTILEKLAKAVVYRSEEAAMAAVKEVIDAKIDPLEAIKVGRIAGGEVVENFVERKYSIPDTILSAQILMRVFEKLEKYIPKDKIPKPLATMVIGAVEGDFHEVGIKIVSAIFSLAGFKVYNIGVDQPVENFIKKAEEVKADIIGASAHTTKTLHQQKVIIDVLKEKGLRKKYKLIIGGRFWANKGTVPGEEWCSEIEADDYATDVTVALEKARAILERK
ncbi:MAG: B12-binding domain-containing protein [Candidatus Hodarchaeota archaeon]